MQRTTIPYRTHQLNSNLVNIFAQLLVFIAIQSLFILYGFVRMDSFDLYSLAVPGVLCFIVFLSYTSQYLFLSIDPRPLTVKESAIFNTLIACLLISYFRAIRTDAGRVPPGWGTENPSPESAEQPFQPKQRWCRRCEAFKPPRSHHCKACQRLVNFNIPKMLSMLSCLSVLVTILCYLQVDPWLRCIPKMDHHCPWTANCVSHRTLPHFTRFVFYCVAAMSYLEYFLYQRAAVIWENRHWPSVCFSLHLILSVAYWT